MLYKEIKKCSNNFTSQFKGSNRCQLNLSQFMPKQQTQKYIKAVTIYCEKNPVPHNRS